MKIVKNEEAVSPVIGVILMVAITVILAAVIAAFVFNIGGNQQVAPQAVLRGVSAIGTALIIEHAGGDTLVAANTNYTTFINGVASNPSTNLTLDLAPGGRVNITLLSDPASGATVDFRFMDMPSGQMIASGTIKAT